MYPDSTDWTPFSSSKTASRHQKQPPASVAISWLMVFEMGAPLQWIKAAPGGGGFNFGSNSPTSSASNEEAFNDYGTDYPPPTPARQPRGLARAGDLARGPGREVREGRREDGRRGPRPGGTCARGRRARGQARGLGSEVPGGPG